MDTLKKTFAVLLIAASSLFAQEDSVSVRGVVRSDITELPRNLKKEVWQFDALAGKYTVRLTAITSVSMHEYLVDGTARVSEVNVGTTGSELVRFYFIEPNVPDSPNGIGQSGVDTVKDKLQEAGDRTGANQVLQKVSKNYPTSTHAHTIEYRISSKETLNKLFKSVEDAWLSGEGGIFKP